MNDFGGSAGLLDLLLGGGTEGMSLHVEGPVQLTLCQHLDPPPMSDEATAA